MAREGEARTAWVGLPESDLLWERFDDEFLLYNQKSGETHFLNVTAAEILIRLQARPQSIPELMTEICTTLNMEENLPLIEQVSGVIREFDRVGLICSYST